MGAFLTALLVAAAAQDQQLGARTKAMGGSYTAFEDDPVSIWLNPAGIATQPDQAAFAYQTYTAYPVDQERGPMDTTVFSVEPEMILSDPAVIPSFFGVVFQLGDGDSPMALGLGYGQPYLLNYAMDRIDSSTQTVFEPENEMKQALSRFRVAFAKDFRIQDRGAASFLTHVSLGAALDVGYERWEFKTSTGDKEGTAASLGWGAGVLVGLFDDGSSFKVNLGAAYQSAIQYDFSVNPDLLPAFDMPQQLNVGVTFYLLEGTPLRLTVDFQWIDWSETAEDPLFAGHPGFEDAKNFSAGLEYRVQLKETMFLYPRVGYRRFDAPWEDKDDLPAVAGFKLVLDTKGHVFNLATFGIGISWTTAEGKVRSVDVAGEAGGDAPNVALGYTHEF